MTRRQPNSFEEGWSLDNENNKKGVLPFMVHIQGYASNGEVIASTSAYQTRNCQRKKGENGEFLPIPWENE